MSLSAFLTVFGFLMDSKKFSVFFLFAKTFVISVLKKLVQFKYTLHERVDNGLRLSLLLFTEILRLYNRADEVYQVTSLY